MRERERESETKKVEERLTLDADRKRRLESWVVEGSSLPASSARFVAESSASAAWTDSPWETLAPSVPWDPHGEKYILGYLYRRRRLVVVEVEV